MKDNSDQQDELQRMLALKRKETPPPRFFKGFSQEVIERIHDPESGKPPTPQERFREFLSSRPVQVGVLSLLVLGCLIGGILASRDVEPPKPNPPTGGMDPKLHNASGDQSLPSLDQPAVVTDGVPVQNRHPDATAVSQSSTSAPPRPAQR
jgi:hypothetical protein